jgi:hypothetical protein
VAAVRFSEAVGAAIPGEATATDTASIVLAAWSIGQSALREQVRDADEDARREGRLVFADAEAMR